MDFVYNIGIYLAEFILKFIALFNDKIKLGVEGRTKSFEILEHTLQTIEPKFWFHCASLGEYEQGLPVFKVLRKDYPDHKIVLTFFSPSGYEIRKNTEIADVVVYLPIDTPSNVNRFLDLVNPELTIFVKYDIWPNYVLELKKREGRMLLISALFRKNQSYFNWYGSFMRNALSAFEHIFVQNNQSKELLKTIEFTNVSVAGDTRYDRVRDQLKQDNTLDFIDKFKQDQLCIVIGSSWPEDEALWIQFINQSSTEGIKFIIAPHTIKPAQIQNLSSKLQVKTVLFSEKENKDLSTYSVFIIDTIGLLSKIYNYADIAYVGGAMGNTGLHNILEPATFGMPIIIGKNYKKFPEAFQMIDNKGVVSIANYDELQYELNSIINDASKRQSLGVLNTEFISKNKGAVVQIVDYIRI